MPDQRPPETGGLAKRKELALRTLRQAVLQDLDVHEDNPQLLLMVGVLLNDVGLVAEAVETYGADANRTLTQRNLRILRNMQVVDL